MSDEDLQHYCCVGRFTEGFMGWPDTFELLSDLNMLCQHVLFPFSYV